jgi:Fe-S-cluster containining protein
MGEIIEVLEEMEPFFFRIRFTVTSEERIVSIDPEKQDLYRSQDMMTLRPMACPFLRETVNKKFICSVHTSRPELCRQYSCYRILVLDSQDNHIGRVTDASRYFTTADPDLRVIWNREIAGVAILNEGRWETFVEQILTHAGYRILR